MSDEQSIILKDIKTLKEENYKLQEQLNEAISVIEFYGNGHNYGQIDPDQATYSVICISDLGDGEFMVDETNDDEEVGGKRARKFLAKYIWRIR